MEVLLDHALVVMDEQEEKVGSFFLAESAKEKSCTGKVIAVGPGAHRHRDNVFVPTQTKVGQTIYVNPDRKMEVTVNGETFSLFKEKNVYGVLNEKDEVEPLFSYVLVKLDELEKKVGSFFIVGHEQDEPRNKGTVLAVGPGFKKDDGTYIPVNIPLNSRVLFDESEKVTLKKGGHDLVLVAYEHVIAILEE